MSNNHLTAERLRELLDYDPETGYFRWRRDVGARAWKGQLAGTMARDGYEYIGIDRRRYPAHRLAWLYVHGEWPRGLLRHLNWLRSDNRLENLREAGA